MVVVLHPKYKLKYFEKKGWDDETIKATRNLVYEEFDRAYAHLSMASDITAPSEGDGGENTENKGVRTFRGII